MGYGMNYEKLKKTKRYSHIGMHSKSNITYAMQYKTAFNILYESDAPVDTIALPMMFLMRHYLEVTLKYNIKYFSNFSYSDSMVSRLPNEHKLEPLANAFREHWGLVVKKYKLKIDDKEYISHFQDLIKLMNEIDKYSMSFRYSHDKDNTKHFKWDEVLDIYTLKKLFDKVTPFLDYSMEVFYEQTAHIRYEEEMMAEIEKEWESEMMSHI